MPHQNLQSHTSLVLSVRFLHGRYHGSEWPPSPRRLFLALVYALYMGKGRLVEINEGERALRSLEVMSPPEIYAPRQEQGCRYTIFVPNNDRDVGGNPKKLTTNKVLAPYIVNGPVRYSWKIDSDNHEDAEILCRLATSIPSLGLGIDPVAAHGQVTDAHVDEGLLLYVPSDQGKFLIQVPIAGLLTNAKKRHEMFRTRLNEYLYTKPMEITRWKAQGYKTKTAENTLVGFRVSRIEVGNETPLRRDIILDSIKSSLIKEVNRMKDIVVGSKYANRVRTTLLPSIGNKYADVMVRRVAFLTPPNIESMLKNLDRRILDVENNAYQLEVLGADDPVLKAYKQSSRFFASVTPIKIGQMKRRQVPNTLVDKLENEVGSTITFVSTKNEPHWGTKSSIKQDGVFAELEFESKVAGPLIVGEGQEQGYGLLAPMTVPDVAYFRILGDKVPVFMALTIGNAMRKAALSKIMRRHKQVPSSISGHERDGRPLQRNHDHAFWIPFDSDQDGLIDHLVIYLNGGFDHTTREALGRITKIYDGSSVNLNVRLVDFFTKKDMKECTLFGSGTRWVSATPYFMPWHAKKNFGLEAQLKKECKKRGYGPVSIANYEMTVAGRHVPELLFVNNNADRKPINKTGKSVALKFSKNVRGPIALGFGCHFGLGMFVPETYT